MRRLRRKVPASGARPVSLPDIAGATRGAGARAARQADRQCAARSLTPGFASAVRRRFCFSRRTKRTLPISLQRLPARNSRHDDRPRLQSHRARRRRARASSSASAAGRSGRSKRCPAIASAPGRRRPTSSVARAAAEAGVAGLEFYRGIPGSDRRRPAHERRRAWRRNQRRADRGARRRPRRRGPDVFTARRWAFPIAIREAPDDVIFTRRPVSGPAGEPAEILAQMERITAAREASQPIREKTGGSTFKNPPGEKAWMLIDAAGCRGLDDRRRAGLDHALQFSDQPRRGHRRRDRGARRGSAPPRVRESSGVELRMGDQADRRSAS